jgi:uncharacterized protein (DUF486 family)
MTFAWYGHLKYRNSLLWLAILASWLIAFVEYCFQVPANRIGSYQYSAAQLKTIQEVITLSVFSILLSFLPSGRIAMELSGGVCIYGGSRLLHVQEVIVGQ